jgi:hypothetical protein
MHSRYQKFYDEVLAFLESGEFRKLTGLAERIDAQVGEDTTVALVTMIHNDRATSQRVKSRAETAHRLLSFKRTSPERLAARYAQKMASEVYVDENGVAHDDEGNSWPVRGWGEGTYGGRNKTRIVMQAPQERSYSPRKPRNTVPDLQKRIRRLLLVLETTRETKSKKFLREKSNSTSMTAGQLRWVESLENKYKRKLADMPDDPPLKITFSGVTVDGSKLRPADQAKIEKHFGLTPGRGNDLVIGPRVSAPTPVSAPKPSPAGPVDRFQFDRGEIQKMVPILERLVAKTQNRMFESFLSDLKAGKGLSDKQLKAIRHKLYQTGGRADAALFKR